MNHSKLRKTTNTKNKRKTNSRSYFDPIKDLFTYIEFVNFSILTPLRISDFCLMVSHEF